MNMEITSLVLLIVVLLGLILAMKNDRKTLEEAEQYWQTLQDLKQRAERMQKQAEGNGEE